MIKVPTYSAIELDTGNSVEGYYYLENGFFISDNGKTDLTRPVQRHKIVDGNGQHLEIAIETLSQN